MPETGGDRFDAIIIGAGISGLVCGCYLAKAGLKVLIVEQHGKPGGYFTSFKRKGFLFDAAAHSFGNYREGGHVRKVLSDLDVQSKISIRRSDPSDIIVTPDFNLTIHNDIQETVDDLSRAFPQEREALHRFFKFVTTGDQTAFSALRERTFGSLLSDYFKDAALISSLAFPVFGSGGLPPNLMQSFIGVKIFSEFILDGGYYPEGGMQALPDALARRVQEFGGTLRYKSPVDRIVCRDMRAVGIETGGIFFESPHIISACDMTRTFERLLPAEMVPEEDRKALKAMVPSLAFFLLYIGLDGRFPALPSRGTNTWFLTGYDLDAVYRDIREGRCDEKVPYLLRMSPDGRTLLASCLADFKATPSWKQSKEAIARGFLDRIEKDLPGVRRHIACLEAATPATLERYTGNREGAAFGWAKSPSQIFDPIFTKKTSVRGLYLTGHWTGIGFGMPGACYSGYDTARRILRFQERGSDRETV